MSEYKNAPQIRFKDFDDAWEQRKLEDITQIVMGQSPDSINYTDNSDDTVLIQGNADLNNGIVVPRIWSSQITKKSYPNDIIFTVRAPVGEIARNPYFATIGRGVASFKGNDFLYQSLIQKKENNYWNNISAGSTFDSINSDQLKNVIIYLPKNNLEQEKIGELFTNLDNLITLHQRKYDNLVNVKKSLLEKMFPKNSSNIPEIRFKGFTDAWEQRKLNEFSKYITSNLTSSDSVPNGLYKLYDANNEIGMINKNNVKEEYITIIKDGSGVGKVRRLPKNTAFIGTMGGILSNNSDIDFVYYSLFNTDFTKEINGATIPHVYYSNYGNNEYYIPNISEQKEIGKLLTNIDNLITLHQRKQEKLNELKKSMLDKMFI